MPKLESIRGRLQGFEPELIPEEGLRQAAVALVLSEIERQTRILLIERAARAGDPWSGHMAFPGGLVERADPSTRAAAQRETWEEVGVSLEGAEYLGPLGDLQGNPRFRQSRLVVSAHMFHVREPGPFRLQRSEVREAMWVPIADLLTPERQVAHRSPHVAEYRFPGILVGEPERHVVWGLTYRFIDIFLRAIEHPLPERWSELQVLDQADEGRRSG